MTRRRCPYCYCTNTKRNGTSHGKQRYLCRDCFTTWSNLSRPERFVRKLWREYAWEGVSVAVLAKRHGKSRNTIARLLGSYTPENTITRPRSVVVVMDVTYFGSWGILVIIDPHAKKDGYDDLVLYWAEIAGTERTVDYEVATDTIEAMGYRIQAVVIDGRRGVRDMLERKGIPVQHCQFHQLQTITRYLTRRPYLPQNRRLRSIALSIPTTSEAELTEALDGWYALYGDWLKQKDEEGRFTHPRTRRAYFSLRRNLPYLFVYQRATHVSIPNTTNALDGRFGVWKSMLHRHRGCSRVLKTKILRSLFAEAQR